MKKQLVNLISRTNVMRIVLVFVFALGAVSCNEKDDMPEMPVNPESKDLAYVLDNFEASFIAGMSEEDFLKKGKKVPTFKTLVTALVKTKLISTVAKEQLTIFAPSDEAFAQLGLNAGNIGDVPNLKEILLYHAVEGKVYSNMLSNKFVATLNGAAVQINVDNGVKVNDANVLYANIRALNGVIHIVDKVLLPPTKNLVEVALANAPEFSILVAAVQKAGLAGTLSTGGPYTVFAPTNSAFVALLGELNATSLDDISVEALTKVLLYHVVNNRVYSSDLSTGAVTTLNGTFNINVSTLKITDSKGREAGLVPTLLNVQATNGVIHVIDRVILPANL